MFHKFTTNTMKATLNNMLRSKRSQLKVMTHLSNSALGNTASKPPMNVPIGPIFVPNILIPQVITLIYLLLFTQSSFCCRFSGLSFFNL